jgi:tetratricopeptide (TPR) repeat protein
LNSTENERGVVARRLYFAAATVCFILALLSKPSVVLLPLIALTIVVRLQKKALRDCWPLAIWGVIGFVDALLTHHIHKGTNAFQPPVWQRFFVAGDALAFYLVKLFAPFKLIPDYGRQPARVLGQWVTYFVWILPAGALLGCWLVRRRFPWLMCGAAIFVLGVFPMLGLVPFDFQGFSTVADRYLYLSIFGASVVVAFALKCAGPLILQSRFRAAALGGSLAVALVLATVCRAQISYWQDTGTLFHRTLAVNPHSEVAHLQLGYVLLNRGGQADIEEALGHYRAVLETRPHDPPLLYNIGLALCGLERQPEAIPYLRDACARAPRTPMAYYLLADTLAAMGDKPGALAAVNEAFRRFPKYANTELRLARAMVESGDRAGATQHYQSYLRAHPNSAEARTALSRLQSGQQQAATDGR